MCRMVISESDSISLCLIGWRSSQPACARFYFHTVQDLVVNMTENKWWVLLRKKTNETNKQTKNLKRTKKVLGVKYSWVTLFERLLQIQQITTSFTTLVSEGSSSVLPPTWSHIHTFSGWLWVTQSSEAGITNRGMLSSVLLHLQYTSLPTLFHLVFLAIKMHVLV